MSGLEDIRGYIRDINLDMIVNNRDFSIDISRRYNNKFRLFYPSRKLIKYVTEIGGVLTGSRALRCYSIKGKPILDRKVEDWDFIVTLDQAFKICAEMKIDQVPKIDNTISIQNQRAWRHPDYSESYRIGIVDVQLIIREELPEYTEVDGIRIANFGYSISNKLLLASDLYSKFTTNNFRGYKEKLIDQYEKHLSDLKEIVIKFNSIKSY